MNDDPFANAPDVSGEFANAERGPEQMPEVPHDAERWEPWEEFREEPSEKHYTMELTPGGTLEQEVHEVVDDAARARISQAQREPLYTRNLPDEKELDFAGDFEEARRNRWGWDPESRREYENFSKETDHLRFSHERENERGNDPGER